MDSTRASVLSNELLRGCGNTDTHSLSSQVGHAAGNRSRMVDDNCQIEFQVRNTEVDKSSALLGDSGSGADHVELAPNELLDEPVPKRAFITNFESRALGDFSQQVNFETFIRMPGMQRRWRRSVQALSLPLLPRAERLVLVTSRPSTPNGKRRCHAAKWRATTAGTR